MPAYSYFRLWPLGARNGGNAIEIVEFGLTTAGGAVSFAGATFFESLPKYGGAYDAPKAFDGNNATYWYNDRAFSEGLGKYLGVQLPAPIDLTGFSLRSYNWWTSPTGFRFEASVNGVDYVELGNDKDLAFGANETKSWTFARGALRVTQAGAEVVNAPPTKARVTQVAADAVNTPPGTKARVTQLHVEVLRTISLAADRRRPLVIS